MNTPAYLIFLATLLALAAIWTNDLFGQSIRDYLHARQALRRERGRH